MPESITVKFDSGLEKSDIIWAFEEMARQTQKNISKLQDSENEALQNAKKDFERLLITTNRILLDLKK